MKGTYAQLKQNILTRSNPNNLILEKALRDDLSTVSYSDVLQYVRIAMKGMEPSYTRDSKDAGEAVQIHLKRILKDVSYRYQGSVMTNTHIKAHSDIDLLVISEKSYQFDRDNVKRVLNEGAQPWNLNSFQKIRLVNEQAVGDYAGDPLDDLRIIRKESENELSGKYDKCDISLPKAICITKKGKTTSSAKHTVWIYDTDLMDKYRDLLTLTEMSMLN